MTGNDRGNDEYIAGRTGAARFGPLLFLAAIELVWCAILAFTRAVPSGHDGFQYFYVKYYFFNDFIKNGEIAGWLPYLTHGAPAAWWYVVQGGIFDPFAFFLARALGLVSFFPIFYGLLFFEKLFLIAGTWLLAAEHLKSRAAIFAVTAAVTMTTIWYTGAWWNFHLVLPLPFLMFCAHRAVVDFHWKWVAGAGLAFFLQSFGQLTYCLPMTLLFVGAYVALVLASSERRAAFRARFRVSPAGGIAVGLVCAPLLLEFVWLRRAATGMAFASDQRSSTGAVSFATFLDYAGPTDLRAWNQFFSGLTPHLDFTLFAGFVVTGLSVLGLVSGQLDRVQRLFATLTGLAILVAAASPVATVVFYLWPLGDLFRHLALLAPVAKFCCIFFAGATFDRLVVGPSLAAPRRGLAAVHLTFAFWLGLLVFFIVSPDARQSFVEALSYGGLPVLDRYLSTTVQAQLLRGGVFLTLSWVAVRALVRHSPRLAPSRAVSAAVLVLLVDAATYHYLETRARTRRLPAREAALFQFVDLPYFDRRLTTPDDPAASRRWTFAKSEAALTGTRYGAENLLWLADTYQSPERTVYWSAALDSLIRALGTKYGEGVTGTGEMFKPPFSNPVMSAIGGVREPKVRFFRRAVVCPSERTAELLFVNKAFRGEAPILLTTGTIPGALPCDVTALPIDPLPPVGPAAARAVSFTSNHAAFEVTNPTAAPIVMTYSDSWSPQWRARLDAVSVPVMRSDLAYKAVLVPPGSHRVEFTYEDPLSGVIFATQTAGTVAFLVFLAAVVGRGALHAQAMRSPDSHVPAV